MATRTYCDLCGDEIQYDHIELNIKEDGTAKVKKDLCRECVECLEVRREVKRYDKYDGVAWGRSDYVFEARKRG